MPSLAKFLGFERPGAHVSGDCGSGSELTLSKRSGLQNERLANKQRRRGGLQLFPRMSKASIHAMQLVPRRLGSGSPIVSIIPSLLIAAFLRHNRCAACSVGFSNFEHQSSRRKQLSEAPSTHRKRTKPSPNAATRFRRGHPLGMGRFSRAAVLEVVVGYVQPGKRRSFWRCTCQGKTNAAWR